MTPPQAIRATATATVQTHQFHRVRSGAAKHTEAPENGHPLQDVRHNQRLRDQEAEISSAFDGIEAAMAEIAAAATGGGADRIQEVALARLGRRFPDGWLMGTWSQPVNLRRLYAYTVCTAFERLAARQFDRAHAERTEGESASELIRKWGFHAIDITPCADGRLSAVVDYILRIPPTVVTSRRSFAGAMFDVEESLRDWAEVELRRYRDGLPTPAGAATRYLKIGVYHTSSSDPTHEGCAAHGSNGQRAAAALLGRLNDFRDGADSGPGGGAGVAILLVGVDTDTDAITVHVPDCAGRMSLDRKVDNTELHAATRGLGREAAKDAIRAAVASAAGVAADDAATEGMRWFVAYLLKNNMAQIEYVRAYYDGRYPDLGHTERFISVGDGFDDVQMRNLSFQAQMATVEEGVDDLDVGIKVFRSVNLSRDLPIPVLVHLRYNGRVPGGRERTIARALRLERAIRDRYAALVDQGWLYTFVTVRDATSGGDLEPVEGAEFAATGKRPAAGT